MAYVVVNVEGTGGLDYTVLAPNDAIQLSPGPGPESAPYVDLVGSWLYMVGNKPSARSDIAAVGSDATRIVVHSIAPSAGNGGRIRFILLDGGPAHVRRLDESDEHSMVEDNVYIDAWRTTGGALDHIDNAEKFDRDTTPGSEGLMDEIDTARQEQGVP